MPKCILLAIVLGIAAAAHATEHAIVAVDCRYPKGSTSGPGIANASFESSARREYVNVVYALGPDALAQELRRHSGVQYREVSPGHFISAGLVYTVRDAQTSKTPTGFARYEAMAVLVAKLNRSEPINITGHPNTELYFVNGIGTAGWQLVQKQSTGRSTELHISTL
jgi:hypothetical protein